MYVVLAVACTINSCKPFQYILYVTQIYFIWHTYRSVFLHIYLAKELSLFLREIPDVDQISVTLFWRDEEKEIQEWRMPETEKEKGKREKKIIRT